MTHRFRPLPLLFHAMYIQAVGEDKEWKVSPNRWPSGIGTAFILWNFPNGVFMGSLEGRMEGELARESPNSARPGFGLTIPFSIWNTSLNVLVFSFSLFACPYKHCWVTAESQAVSKGVVSNFTYGRAHPWEGGQPGVGCFGDCCVRYIMKSMSYKAV